MLMQYYKPEKKLYKKQPIMNYYLDQEFFERMHKPLIGKAYHKIDLISIGIVAEDKRWYYAICKEFDIKGAWKNEWLRENVLYPIFKEMYEMDRFSGLMEADTQEENTIVDERLRSIFSIHAFKKLLNQYGSTRKQIAEEVFDFINLDGAFQEYVKWQANLRLDNLFFKKHNVAMKNGIYVAQPTFYGYFADYDWVVFCSLWGTMMNLPKGFPKYCRDLKQMLDNKAESINELNIIVKLFSNEGSYQHEGELQPFLKDITDFSLESKILLIKKHPNYPKQINEHSALDDAKWNRDLFDFLNTIK